MRTSIAVDAMGGDHAPVEVVRGAVSAAAELHDLEIHLVGIEDDVRRELANHDHDPSRIHVVAASQVIGMGESPVDALRRKKDSSIVRALRVVREGTASAFVSAGNTGACVAAASLLLRTLPEVKKAGIAVAFYVGTKPVVLLDAGANVEARPEHLFQYGVMASLYVAEVLGIERPSVGLLNVGEEGAKGNRLAKETHALFQQSGLNFHGNVEGIEIFRGVCDVVICDGFTGNVVLKVAEGIAERLFGLFKGAFKGVLEEFSGVAGSEVTQQAGGLVKRAFASIQERLDYAEFGGAPLLGLNGTVIIAHGRSDYRAIANAIRAAKRVTEVDINARIVESIRAMSPKTVSAEGGPASSESGSESNAS